MLALSKHRLFGEQLHKISNYSCDFTGHGIASLSNPDIFPGRTGHAGVGILWSTAFSDSASPLSIDSDRITGVKLTTPDHQSLFVLVVYLPSSNHPTDTFHETFDLLWAVYDHFCNQGITVILAEFSGALGYFGGDRISSEPNDRGRLILEFLNFFNLKAVNFDSVCTGLTDTSFSFDGRFSSAIDLIVVPRA